MNGMLWAARDFDGDLLEVGPVGDDEAERGALAVIHISVAGLTTLGWYVEPASARGLRDALNELLVNDGGSVERPESQATTEGVVALHLAQHRAAEAVTQRIAGRVDDISTALTRITTRAHELSDAGDGSDLLPDAVALLAVQTAKLAASFGDLLAALRGEP